ncbi:MAG: PEP-CTERM sorting domain-containing protein, partial [Fimbriimonadia bacterium]
RCWNDLFVNDVNLIAGVGVTNYSGVQVCDLNDRGDVLWTVADPTTLKWSLYLSSPIPEPGGAALVAAALLLMAVARRRRSRRGSERDA